MCLALFYASLIDGFIAEIDLYNCLWYCSILKKGRRYIFGRVYQKWHHLVNFGWFWKSEGGSDPSNSRRGDYQEISALKGSWNKIREDGMGNPLLYWCQKIYMDESTKLTSSWTWFMRGFIFNLPRLKERSGQEECRHLLFLYSPPIPSDCPTWSWKEHFVPRSLNSWFANGF